MSVTYGFYNSNNHDRRYNAIQMSSIFDGIIKDGVFMSIGDCLEVTADGSSMTVMVGTGRAWFNHTWTLNDTLLPIVIPDSEVVTDRYDAVILEVNSEQSVRMNSIKLVSGEPSSEPEYPVLTNTETIHQYPLAYIYVESGVDTIRQADITSMIGKDETPYVTGILETVSIESMVAQWEDQWLKFFEQQKIIIESKANEWDEVWHTWYHMYTDSSSEEFSNWKLKQKEEILKWFEEIRDMLSEDEGTKIAVRIEDLEKRMEVLEDFKRVLTHDLMVHEISYDSYDDAITDSTGVPITNRILADPLSSPIELWNSVYHLIAEEFSESKSYRTNEYCIYNSMLYRFSKAKVAGAWDKTAVENVTVAGRLVYLQDHAIIDSNK